MLTQYTIDKQALSLAIRQALTKACTRFGSVVRLVAGHGMQNRSSVCPRRALGWGDQRFILRGGSTFPSLTGHRA
jgi:hypothetical protein